MPAPTLDATARKQLRALAHHFEPIVRVGHAGVTDGVVEAVASALLDHELIKVRLYEPEDKLEMAGQLASRCDAVLCGMVGHTVILYRRHPKRPKLVLEPKRAASRATRTRTRTRTRTVDRAQAR